VAVCSAVCVTNMLFLCCLLQAEFFEDMEALGVRRPDVLTHADFGVSLTCYFCV
jgi:hypothetical protein